MIWRNYVTVTLCIETRKAPSRGRADHFGLLSVARGRQQ